MESLLSEVALFQEYLLLWPWKRGQEYRGYELEKPENFHQLGVARAIKLKQDT